MLLKFGLLYYLSVEFPKFFKLGYGKEYSPSGSYLSSDSMISRPFLVDFSRAEIIAEQSCFAFSNSSS